MNRQGKWVLIAGLAIIGLAAAVLKHSQGLQKLGRPGVKIVAENIYREDGKLVDTNSVALPERVLDFQSRTVPLSADELDWLPADTTFGRRAYVAPDGFSMTLSVVLMGRDRTSIHKPEYCIPAQGARIVKTESLGIPVSEPRPYLLPVTRFTISREIGEEGKRQKSRGLYVYWFVADGQITADHNQRMLWMTRDLLTKGTLQRWAYVSCFSQCQPGFEEAVYARMSGLIAAAVPHFQLAAGPAEGSVARR